MAHYLDHAATSPIRPSVLASYTRCLESLGNPASIHVFGQHSRAILEQAREDIAKAVDCDRNEVIFTSGGTESDNLAVKGLYWQARSENPSRSLIITSAAEHHAVLDAIDWLVQEQGAEGYYLKLDSNGQLDLSELTEILQQRAAEVALISLMWANNEIGVCYPIREITELARRYKIPVHSDAIAALGHVDVSFADSGLSAMSITGHKIGSPVGIGALILARSCKLTALQHGGGHERKLRSGTPDAAAAMAFAQTVTAAMAELREMELRHREFASRLIAGVRGIAPDVIVSGEQVNRLPNNVHFRFPGLLGDSLLFLLDQAGVAVSTGSACTAGVAGPSHVVLALGADNDQAMATLRLTFGHSTQLADIEAFLHAFPAAYQGALKAGVSRR